MSRLSYEYVCCEVFERNIILMLHYDSSTPEMCGNEKTRCMRFPVAQTPNGSCSLVISSDFAYCFQYCCLSVIYNFVGMIYNARATALMGKRLIK